MESNRPVPARCSLVNHVMGGAVISLLLCAVAAQASDKPKFSLPTIPEAKRETFPAALEQSWATGNSDRLRDLWGTVIRVMPGGLDRFPEDATPRGILTLWDGEFFSYGRNHLWRGRLQLKTGKTLVSGLASILYSWQDIGGGWKIRYFLVSGPLACGPAPWPLGNRSPGIPVPETELQYPGFPETHGGISVEVLAISDNSMLFHDDRIYRTPGNERTAILTQERPLSMFMLSQFSLGDGILLQAKSSKPVKKHSGPAQGTLEIIQPRGYQSGQYWLSFLHLADECQPGSRAMKPGHIRISRHPLSPPSAPARQIPRR